MKVLFVGQLETPGWVSTSKMRMVQLGRLGHEVIPLDVCEFHGWGGPTLTRIVDRLKLGPPLRGLARKIEKTAGEHRPEVVWVEKGTWVLPRTLRRLRSRHRCLLVHYTPDAAFVHNRSRHFSASIPIYDLLVTTKSYEEETYRKGGARELLLQYPSFDLDVHRPETPTARETELYGSDVAFVGTYNPGRERYLTPVSRLGVDLAIWGAYWRERCRFQELRPHVRGSGVAGRDYALALSATKIGLGLLSPVVPDRSTTRSLEIPACGTFLLAERTEEHQALFEEGEEAEFFSSEAELTEKVRYYLEHAGERRRIALAGRARCFSGGYSSQDRVREIMSRVAALLEETGSTASTTEGPANRCLP